MIKKTWKEFQQCKLLWWVNRSLHLFGWAIVIQTEESGEITDVYPARVTFRGFVEADEDSGFEELTRYLAAESDALMSDLDLIQETTHYPAIPANCPDNKTA